MKVQSAPLNQDDVIEISVTHEIKIKGDKTWVGARMSSKVREGETTEDAEDRVGRAVDEAVMRQIHRTVETVERVYQ